MQLRWRRSTVIVALLATAGLAAAACGGPPVHVGIKASGLPIKATTSVDVAVPPDLGGASAAKHKLRVPPGWTVRVWARVPDARMEAWTPQGDLLVSQPGGGTVAELVPDGHGTARSRTVLTGLTQPQGLAFARIKGRWVLYVAEADQVVRYRWGKKGIGGPPRVIAPHLPGTKPDGDDNHIVKDVAVAPDGTIYFNVGSSSNANPDDRTFKPPRATIISVRPDGSDLRVAERGVRNGEGLAVAPDGTVWTAVNNRDNIPYPFHSPYAGHHDAFGQVIQSYVNNHPPDEVVPVTQGRDLGWPYCNPDQDVNHPAGSLAQLPLVRDALTNPRGHHLNCAGLPPINIGLPAHSAPLGLSFLDGSRLPSPWRNGAVVAVHGSWNRVPPRPPAVLWLAWNAAKHTLEPAVVMVTGFQNPDGSRWGRPADAVPGPDGALYISDDTAGAVYRLAPPTSNGS
jgi:glucose/arabinose dehydrogenase